MERFQDAFSESGAGFLLWFCLQFVGFIAFFVGLPPPPHFGQKSSFPAITAPHFPANHCSALFGPGCWSRDEPHGIDWNWPFHFQLFSQKMNGGSPSAVVTWVPWWGPILPRSTAGFSTLQGPRSSARLRIEVCCCCWVAEHGMFCYGVKEHEGKASG